MHRRQDSSARRGVILLVVLALLTLFAVVGLSFVMVANTHGRAAQLHRETETAHRPAVDPELLFSYFLGQLLYDVPDDEAGVFSALRGHSLARSMYAANTHGGNLIAYNGTGRLREAPSPFGTILGDFPLLNYTYYPTDPQLPLGQGFLRDPERLRWRTDLNAPRGPFTGGFNASYTYPDLNSVFLAAVRGSDGAVLLPSFHRPWAGTAQGKSGDFFDRETNARNPLWDPATLPMYIPAWYKYTTLRPLPALNPGFPAPEDGGGDVKNLVAGPGTLRRMHDGRTEFWNNDSFWMDLGFPVLRAPDGRKYKPLFAALITDLDNRINVNIHGNALGTGGQHRSNQGWGPWEVNVSKVLGQPSQPPHEAGRLLRGMASNPPSPIWDGRYGPDGQPTGRSGPMATEALPPHFYAQVDADGHLAGAVSPRWELPPPRGQRGLRSAFPVFGHGHGNASASERTNHPALFDYFSPTRQDARTQDRILAISNMEALLRYGDTGSPALTADLFRLCPTNFRQAVARNLITTHSFDLDLAGAPPWLAGATPYTMPPTEDVDQLATPRGPAQPFRSLAERTQSFDNGEFRGTDWRSLVSALGRINLNRPLPPYPHRGRGITPPFGPPLTLSGSGQVALDMPFAVDAPAGPIFRQYQMAQAARQQLANDLYRRLLAVTGVRPITRNPGVPPLEELRIRRWLAQLAVNMVDYLDDDEISTPFLFYTALDSPLQPPDAGRVNPSREPGRNGEIQWPVYWVFGTELPRVVLNEAMAQVGRNDPQEPYSDTVRVFVELHNTFPRQVPPGAYQGDSAPAPLRMGAGPISYAPYRILLGTKQEVQRTTGIPTIATILPGIDNDNVLGNPALNVIRQGTTDSDFTGPTPVPLGETNSASGSFARVTGPTVPAHGPDTDTLPQGMFLLGPLEQAGDPHDPFRAAPAVTPRLRLAGMQYDRQFLDDGEADERQLGISVVLRRLANPYLPFDPRRTVNDQPNPTYNPFLTVDYLEQIPLQPVQVDPPETLVAMGKPQPYASLQALLEPQPAGVPPLAHTFGRENLPGARQYDWLTHLDRPATSPLELLNVSGCQPYQLTQRFVMSNGRKHAHRAPWFDEDLSGGSSHRLYRFFDFIEAGSQAAGIAAGGRLPGKVNINTIWDRETLQALADPQDANHFRQDDVDQAFAALLYDANQPAGPQRRTQGAMPGPNDQPFWGLSMGNYPRGDSQFRALGGADDTLLRLRHAAPARSDHPYLQAEMLSKMFGHLTTRSNVFAVWLTVGFFEVTDESVRPVKLGAELGRSENRQVRHRLFAVLDRTNLSVASSVATLTAAVLQPSPQPQTIPVSAVNGVTELAATGPSIRWEIKPGDSLVLGAGATQEIVEVLEVSPAPAIKAVFTRPHAVGTPLSLTNTPGAPPIFLKPLKMEPTDSGYTITVAIVPSRSTTGQTLGGDYDGIPWTLRENTRLFLGVGADQEPIQVTGPLAVDTASASGQFRVTTSRTHPADATLTNTLLGNPGPVPRFNPRDPAAAGVVRYLSVIQ